LCHYKFEQYLTHVTSIRNVKQGHYETYADTGTCVYNLASDLHVEVQTMISH